MIVSRHNREYCARFDLVLALGKLTPPLLSPTVAILIVTIVPILAGTCDLESLVASGHK